jgi:hypothetical protein
VRDRVHALLPLAGAGFAPPPLYAYAEGRRGGNMALGVADGEGERRCSFEADAASECTRERCGPSSIGMYPVSSSSLPHLPV